MEFPFKVVMPWMCLEPGRCAGAEWDHAAGHSPAAAPATAHQGAGCGSSANLGELPLCKLQSCDETQSNLILVCILMKMCIPVMGFLLPNYRMNSVALHLNLAPVCDVLAVCKTLGTCGYDISAIHKPLIILSKCKRCFSLSSNPFQGHLGEDRLRAKTVGMLGGGERVTSTMGPIAGARPLPDLWADMLCPLLPSINGFLLD